MSIKELEQEIISEFSMFDDLSAEQAGWMQKYEHIIELGKELPLIDEQFKTDDYIIKGCQSKVWLNAEMKDGKVIYSADSDAIITKGIISLLLRVFNNQTPQEIISTELTFIDEIGLKEHLSPTRSNGLLSMIKQIKTYALAFSAKA
jgi:cysteine desulfuration protein SufE